MIRTKSDYLEYLECDKKALGLNLKRPRLFRDEIWVFQRLLRKVEYYTNCKQDILSKIVLKYYKFKYHRLSIKLSFYIPINVFGKGLSLAHVGPIIINDYAKIGDYCRVHVGVNIGASLNDPYAAPKIGNNVYIGPGAKIYGNITIGDDVAIGANAVVNKSFDNKVTLAGVPAKIVSDKGNIRVMK